MSMISEQLSALRDVAGAYQHNGLGLILKEAADTIETLSAKLAVANIERSDRYYGGGWVYCGDGKNMPDEEGRYLCTLWSGEVFECIYGWNYPRTDKKFFHTQGSAISVVAWQPLPKPYHEP